MLPFFKGLRRLLLCCGGVSALLEGDFVLTVGVGEKCLDLLLIGVEPEWQSKGVVALLFMDLFQTYKRLGFKYAETNAELETNT